MPVEETENEIRVRVRSPDDFIKASVRQLWPRKTAGGNIPADLKDHWPYNEEGIRAIGGRLKSNSDSWDEQSIRFSKADKYDWTPAKAERWVRDHDMTPKGLSWPVDIPFQFDFEIKALKLVKDIPQAEQVKDLPPDTEVLYVEGIATTGSLDREDEVVDQPTLDIEEYLKNPILLYHHNPSWPVGRVVKLDKDAKDETGEPAIWVRAAVIGATDIAKEAIALVKAGIIKAFSIGGKARTKRRMCDKQGCFTKLLGLKMYELSIVPIPANAGALFNIAKALIPDHAQDFEDELGGFETLGVDEITEDMEAKNMPDQERAGAPPAETMQEPPESGADDVLQRVEALETTVKDMGEKVTALTAKVEEMVAAMQENAEPTDEKDKMPPVEKGDVFEVETGTKKSLIVIKGVTKGEDGNQEVNVEKADREAKKQLAAQVFKAIPDRKV
jgi:HK97 family phage prohead protease